MTLPRFIRAYLSRRAMRDIYLKSEMPAGSGEPHSHTVNSLMKQALGMTPRAQIERLSDPPLVKELYKVK